MCEDVHMWGCEPEKMWRWEDVKMWVCEGQKMWRCKGVSLWDVKMRRCEYMNMWVYEHVSIWTCEGVKMWTCEDVKQTPTSRRNLRSDALGKKGCRKPALDHLLVFQAGTPALPKCILEEQALLHCRPGCWTVHPHWIGKSRTSFGGSTGFSWQKKFDDLIPGNGCFSGLRQWFTASG